MSDEPKGLAGVVKEQLALIALLVLFSGTAYADAYYSQFAIKFTQLGLDTSYIIYRGITLGVEFPSVTMPYIALVIWLIVDEFVHWKFPRARTVVAYLVVTLAIILSYALAYRAGIDKANKDIHAETSTLFRIKSATPAILGCPPDECRLVLANSENYYVIHPLEAKDTSSIPNVIAIPRNSINELITGAQ